MENETETGVVTGLSRDPSIQTIPTLRPRVCRYDIPILYYLDP